MVLRSLNQKMIVAAAFVLVVVLMFTTLAASALLTLRSKANHLVTIGRQAELSGDLDTNIVRAAGELATLIATGRQQYEVEAAEALARAQRDLDQLAELPTYASSNSTPITLSDLFQRQSALLARLQADFTMIQSAREDRTPQNIASLLDRVFAYEQPAVQLHADLTSYFDRENNNNQREVAAAIRNVIASVVAMLVALVLIIGLGAILLQRQIIRPILALSSAAHGVAQGDFQHEVLVTNYDEIGELQRLFNQMVVSLRQQHAALDQHAIELGYAVSEAQSARRLAEEASRAKSAFLSTMSHELRTPLTAILGYTDLIKLEAAGAAMLSPSLQHDLGQIEGASKHLLMLINAVLEISKIEAGKMTLMTEEFDLAALISEIVLTMQPLIAQNGNHLITDTAGAPSHMYSDPTKLRQVLFNLIGNAAKFTIQGTIELYAAVEQSSGHDWVVFRITDTGIGIAAEQLPRLFQDFTQADDTRTRKYGGTGLGLALSRQLCLLLGGDIWVESELDRGSTFTVRLPLDASLTEVTR